MSCKLIEFTPFLHSGFTDFVKKKKKKEKKKSKRESEAETSAGSTEALETANSNNGEPASETTPPSDASQSPVDATQPQAAVGTPPNSMQLENVQASTSSVQQTENEYSSQKLTMQGQPPASPAPTPEDTKEASTTTSADQKSHVAKPLKASVSSPRRSSSPPPPGVETVGKDFGEDTSLVLVHADSDAEAKEAATSGDEPQPSTPNVDKVTVRIQARFKMDFVTSSHVPFESQGGRLSIL